MNNFFETWFGLMITVLLASIFVAVLAKAKPKRQASSFPSGPCGLPVVGNTLSLVTKPIHLKLSEWAYKFGDIYMIHLGPRPAVVVNDLAIMKELFSAYPASTGKLLTDLFKFPFGGKYGLLCVDGQHWQEQRQFCIKNLRTFGYGKGATMEPMIVDEANDVIEWLRKEGVNGRPVEILGVLQKATINALWALVTGEKILFGDTRFVNVMHNWMYSAQRTTKTGLAFLPWLKYLAPQMSGYNMAYEAGKAVYTFIREYIVEHQHSCQEGSPRDLIDAFLEQMKREKDSSSSFYGEEGWKHSVATIVTLFFGGGETTATTLTWLIFYLCCDTQVQQNLQDEIDREIGRDRDPSLKDRLSMPYTEAVILETLRKSSFLPLGLMHELTDDLRFQNYLLPKDTVLIGNLYHIHHDKGIWGDPHNFRPERFLCGDKSLTEYVVGFHVGKRQCLGAGLARDIMFLFVAKLFQKFQFSADPRHEKHEYPEPVMGFCLETKHLPIVVSCRESIESDNVIIKCL